MHVQEPPAALRGPPGAIRGGSSPSPAGRPALDGGGGGVSGGARGRGRVGGGAGLGGPAGGGGPPEGGGAVGVLVGGESHEAPARPDLLQKGVVGAVLEGGSAAPQESPVGVLVEGGPRPGGGLEPAGGPGRARALHAARLRAAGGVGGLEPRGCGGRLHEGELGVKSSLAEVGRGVSGGEGARQLAGHAEGGASALVRGRMRLGRDHRAILSRSGRTLDSRHADQIFAPNLLSGLERGTARLVVRIGVRTHDLSRHKHIRN